MTINELNFGHICRAQFGANATFVRPDLIAYVIGGQEPVVTSNPLRAKWLQPIEGREDQLSAIQLLIINFLYAQSEGKRMNYNPTELKTLLELPTSSDTELALAMSLNFQRTALSQLRAEAAQTIAVSNELHLSALSGMGIAYQAASSLLSALSVTPTDPGQAERHQAIVTLVLQVTKGIADYCSEPFIEECTQVIQMATQFDDQEAELT